MKKIKNKITALLSIAIILATSILSINVKAYTTEDTLYLDYNYQWWVSIYNRANTHMVATQETMMRRTSDNKPVYCIQPHIQFNDWSSVKGIVDTETMISMSSLSAQQMERIKLISYYGYGFGNHTSPEWFYSTQLLIWETVKPGYVYAIADGDYSLTPSSRYDSYYNELNYLVDNHATAPSFSRKTFEMTNNETITIQDTNNVLSKFYDDVETDNYIAKIDGNNLVITAKRGYTGVIELNVKDNDNPPMIYEGANQLCMSAGDPVMIKSRLNLFITVPFEGHKLYGDKDDDNYRPEKNAKFEVYDNKTNELIATLISNEKGIINYNFKLGEYRIHQIEGKEGFDLIDDYILKVDGNSLETVYFHNNAIKGNLEFTKTDISESKSLPNTLIEIYTVDGDELIFNGRTDSNGKIIISNLKYGKYYILEKEAPTGYQINEEKMFFEIKNDGEIVKITMKDEIIKGSLEFTKEDLSNGEALPDTLIEIYDAETDELVFSGRTNEEGKIIVESLDYGKYYILEKEAPEGYEINEEKMYFEILEDGEIIKATMKDEKIVEVPDTEKYDYHELIIGGIILMIAGISVVIYGKKRKK